MDAMKDVADIVVHLDTHLAALVNQYGTVAYAILFVIIFAETGFVVTPFLPGDSLLFAAGAIASLGSLRIDVVLAILIFAAILGDTVNYWVGHFFGRTIVDNPRIRFINQQHIDKTERFYKTYGGKTIFLARFIPIIRTFAPFVAGVGSMTYSKFILFNVIGGVTWVTVFTIMGYLFGNIPIVKDNFHYAVVAIIGLSLVPIVYEYVSHRILQKNPNVLNKEGNRNNA